MRFALTGPLVALVLVALLAWSTTRGDDAAPADLVVINTNESHTLDPQRMSYLQDLRLAGALYEGLVRWDPDDASVRPGVAALPEVSADGRRYVFRLDPAARWSNGQPVTAHDFAFAWKRAMLPDTAADYSNLFMAIEGASDFFAARVADLEAFASEDTSRGDRTAARARAAELWARSEARFRDTVGVRALDAHTLEVRLERALPYFLDLACFGVFSPVHRPTVEGWPAGTEAAWPDGDPPPIEDCTFVALDPVTGSLRQDHGWAKPGRHVGNGPYRLTAWRYKRDMRLERSPYARRPDAIQADTIRLLTVEDANTALLTVATGQADWLIDVSVGYKSALVEARRAYDAAHPGAGTDGDWPDPGEGERRDLHVVPAFGTDFFNFNCRSTLADGRPNPFAEAAVRRAFVAATDRHQIVEQVTRLGERVVTSITPPGSIPGYTTPEGLGYDVDRARRELADAGWTDRDGDGRVEDAAGQPFPTVEVMYTTNTSRYRWIALALKDQWERALGVEIALVARETKAYRDALKRGDFMIARGRWYGDYGDPTTFLDLFRTDGGNNDRGFSDPEIDALLDQAAAERDPAARFALLEECERRLFTEHLPLVPICQLVELFLYDPAEVAGVGHHPRLVQDLSRVRRRTP